MSIIILMSLHLQPHMASTKCQLSIVLTLLCIIQSSLALVFLSIDCGSTSSSYRDGNLIDWSGDNDYINTGESRVVPSNNSRSPVLDSLRVFNNGRKKNCYSIKSIRQGQVMLRASFYYGNYDGRSSPPSFDLHYDGNYWATVETSTTEYVNHEVIYVMKSSSITVCVAQTRQGEFPFISALEVRGLEMFMYLYGLIHETEYPLFMLKRVAYGSNSTIRYGDDQYDRIWTPARPRNGSGLIEVSNNVTFGELTIASDRPPPVALQHAVTAVSPNTTIYLSAEFPEIEIPVYITWYFSEVTLLSPNETRTFSIFLGNESMKDPISPPYLNATEWVAAFYNVSSNTTISLVPTNNSTLPPLINAMEVFRIGDPLTNGTDNNDVKGLASLQKTFTFLGDWRGDPCLPAPFSWDWIQCNNDTRPRVTTLLLGSFGLSGVLPDFSSMDALRTIDFHNNSLQGPIPEFLGTLPELTNLNVANNQFNGSIPASLSHRNGLNLVVTGNSGLCTSSNLSCPATNQPGNAALTLKKKNILHMFTYTNYLLYYLLN